MGKYITEDTNSYSIDGLKIKEKRIKIGYTQEQLSELSGVSRSQVQRIESGKSENCTITTCIKLTKALNLNLYEIIKSTTTMTFEFL